VETYLLPCLFQKFTGIPCPGCGGQRSVVHLLHGEFGEAFFMYPAIYPLIIVGLLIAVNYIFPFEQYSRWISAVSLMSVAVVLINYGIKLNLIYHII